MLVGAVKFYCRVLISLNKASDLKLRNGAFKECGRYALPMISVVSMTPIIFLVVAGAWRWNYKTTPRTGLRCIVSDYFMRKSLVRVQPWPTYWLGTSVGRGSQVIKCHLRKASFLTRGFLVYTEQKDRIVDVLERWKISLVK